MSMYSDTFVCRGDQAVAGGEPPAGSVLPVGGPRSWILVLDSRSPPIHQALFGLWHAAPLGVFPWSLFWKAPQCCGAGNYRHQQRISPQPAALLIATAGRWLWLHCWEWSTGCRLSSSACLQSTGLFLNALSAIPGQALPANFQPDLWRPSSTITTEGSGKTLPALSKRSPYPSLQFASACAELGREAFTLCGCQTATMFV